jgi:hypothetical protein
MEQLKQLALNNNTTGASIYDLGNVIKSESIAELTGVLKKAEEKSQQVNNEIETRIVEKTKVIKEKGKIQIEYINRLVEGKTVEIVKDMSESERQEFLAKQQELQNALKNCPVPRIIVEEHNKAAGSK